MSLHSQGQRLQFGRLGGGHGRRTERREQEESETRNGDPEKEMDLLSVETVGVEVQFRREGSVSECGVGASVREVELRSYCRRENERFLMEMVAPEVEQRIWKDGWPQPGDNENGNCGGAVKGGQKFVVCGGVGGEQMFDDDNTVAKNGRRRNAAEDSGSIVAEPKWVVLSSMGGRKI